MTLALVQCESLHNVGQDISPVVLARLGPDTLTVVLFQTLRPFSVFGGSLSLQLEGLREFLCSFLPLC